MLTCSMLAGFTPCTSPYSASASLIERFVSTLSPRALMTSGNLPMPPMLSICCLQRDDDLLLAAAAREVRSLPVVAVAGPGVDERRRPVHVLLAGVEMHRLVRAVPLVAFAGRVLIVGEPRRHIDVDAADSVHRLLERLEIDTDEVVDADAEQMLDAAGRRPRRRHRLRSPAPDPHRARRPHTRS